MMDRRISCKLLAALAVVAVLACPGSIVPASAELINVDFNYNSGTTSPTYTDAAVLGGGYENWNGVDQFSLSPLALTDSIGAPTGISLNYSNVTGFSDLGSNITYNGPATALMEDYIFENGSGSATVTLSGLTPNGEYDLVLYSDGQANQPLATDFTVGGVTETAADPTGAAVFGFVVGQDYVQFDTFADGNGQLNIDFTGTPGFGTNGHLNGLQIASVSVPEPTTLSDYLKTGLGDSIGLM